MVASGLQFLFGRFGFLGYNNYVCLFYFYYHRLLNAVKQYCNTFKVKKCLKQTCKVLYLYIMNLKLKVKTLLHFIGLLF